MTSRPFERKVSKNNSQLTKKSETKGKEERQSLSVPKTTLILGRLPSSKSKYLLIMNHLILGSNISIV